VGVFLGGHAVEDGGRGRIIRAQAFGIAAVDAGVILFGRNGEGEDFAVPTGRKNGGGR
jgi:hypothetical protein